MTDQAFGRWLRRQIENRRLTVSQFSRQAAISRCYVTRLLNGRRRPTTGLLVSKIAHGLGVDREVIESALRELPLTAA